MNDDPENQGDSTPSSTIARAANMLTSEVGPEGTIEIFELFVRDARSRADETANAHQARNAMELRRAAHSFASVCRTVGADDFATILEAVERSAVVADFNAASGLITRAFQELGGVLRLVESEVDRLRKEVA